MQAGAASGLDNSDFDTMVDVGYGKMVNQKHLTGKVDFSGGEQVLNKKGEEKVKIAAIIEFNEKALSVANNNCKDCPTKDSVKEYFDHKSSDGITYTLIAGNWIVKYGKEGQTLNQNNTSNYYYNNRWIPLYAFDSFSMASFIVDYVGLAVVVGVSSVVITKSFKVGGVTLLIDFVWSLGAALSNDARAHQQKYYTANEILEVRDFAKKRLLEYKGVTNPQTGRTDYAE